jgi:hypothetical protein
MPFVNASVPAVGAAALDRVHHVLLADGADLLPADRHVPLRV